VPIYEVSPPLSWRSASLIGTSRRRDKRTVSNFLCAGDRVPVTIGDATLMLGMGTIAKKVFGTPNDRKVKATRKIVAQINALEPEFQALSD